MSYAPYPESALHYPKSDNIRTVGDVRDEKRRNDYSDAELAEIRIKAALAEYPLIGTLIRNGKPVYYLNGRHFESSDIHAVIREYSARGCI